MTANLRQVLHDAFELEAAAPPPPVGLAATAISRHRRRQLVRTVVAVALVGAAGVGVLPFIRSADAGRSLMVAADTGPKKQVVAVVDGIGGMPAEQKSLLLNPSTGRYDTLPYSHVLPSPDGRWAIVHKGDNSRAYPSRTGVLDRRTKGVRWLDRDAGYINAPGSWSPDSKRFVLTDMPRTGTPAIVLVDVATLRTTSAAVPSLSANGLGDAFVWSPKGDELLITLGMPADKRVLLWHYSLAGEATSSSPAGGRLISSRLFSPDGSRVALNAGDSDTFPILDVRTGVVRAVVPMRAEPIGWYDDDHLVVRVWDRTGDRLEVVTLAGKVVRTVALPHTDDSGQHVYLAPVAGLSDAAAKHGF